MTDAPECFQPESGHTQTPWRIFTNPDGTKLVGIGAEDGQGILDAGFGVWAWNDAEGIANSELVVKAVNSYDEAMMMLGDVPGETLLDRLSRLQGWYLEMQILVGDLKHRLELAETVNRLSLSRPTSGGAA